jgi:hypothetical protein
MFVESVDNQTNCTKADIIKSNTTTHNSTAPINSVNRKFKLSKKLSKVTDCIHLCLQYLNTDKKGRKVQKSLASPVGQ